MELIIDARLEGSNHCSLENSAFLLGDRVIVSDESFYIGEHKWLREMEVVRIFLSNMARNYPLVYFSKVIDPSSYELESDHIARRGSSWQFWHYQCLPGWS